MAKRLMTPPELAAAPAADSATSAVPAQTR
jgi:hypothetical protein